MKIKIEGFIDNTQIKTQQTEIDNVMGATVSADTLFLDVSFYDSSSGQMKNKSFNSLEWAKGIIILP